MSKLIYAVPFVIGCSAWLASESAYLTAVVGLSFGFYFLYWLPRMTKPFFNNGDRQRQCYQFINSFVIALSVKKTLGGALESVLGQVRDDLRTYINSNSSIDTMDILTNLRIRFPFRNYDMFLTIIDLYTEQGGSILKMSHLLLANLREEQNSYQARLIIAKRKLSNYVILWSMTLIVLVFARYGIADLFMNMASNPIFMMGLGAYFLFMLYAIHAWTTRFMRIDHE